MAFKLVSTTQADRNVTPIADLSDDALVTEYDRIHDLLSADVNLFNIERLVRHEVAIAMVTTEGKKQQILYFLDSDELLATCKDIFGEETIWAK